jgi:ribose transport system substrate-binding protein
MYSYKTPQPEWGAGGPENWRRVFGMKKSMLLGVALVVVAAIGACGSDNGGSTAKSGGGAAAAKYAFVSPNTGNAFHISYQCGLVRAAKAAGVSLDVQGSNKFAADAQIPIVQAEAAKKPDALITAATDTRALRAPLNQIKQAGTKVILYDTGLDDTSVAESFIASDNVGGGRLVADALAKSLGGKGLVLPIDLAPGVASTNARAKGFIEQIKKYPGIKVLPTQFDNITPTKDAQIVSATLSTHPDLAAIVPTYNDAAIASLAALKGNDRGKNVKMFTFDADPRIVDAIKAGRIEAAATQQPYLQAQETLDQAMAAVAGKPVKKSELIPMITVTKDNVGDKSLADKGFYVSSANGCS